MSRRFYDILELSKVRITALVTLTTTCGYIICSGQVNVGIVAPLLGTFLLACGSAVLNHVQEKDLDARMERTRNRALPAGRTTARFALILAVALSLAGAGILGLFTNRVALSLGLLTMFWYNGVYVYLKRLTVFAVVPGAIVGAIPPLIGWAAAGCSVLNAQAAAIFFFFFLWQIPHFWLLLLKYGDDYQMAGLPSLTTVFAKPQLNRLTFLWIFASAISCFVFPLYGLLHSHWTTMGFAILSLWLVLTAAVLLLSEMTGARLMKLFAQINVYVLFVTILLAVDSLLA
ncbi:protoheme IX farnesyltransferase [Oligoflexia bacterium]|nr:protoheme IX farnesyltransferase [Oligoflexia bacterium]